MQLLIITSLGLKHNLHTYTKRQILLALRLIQIDFTLQFHDSNADMPPPGRISTATAQQARLFVMF